MVADLFLSERMRQVLQMVIEDYILSAEPVGSRTISGKSTLHLSPASIRNIMSELEALGLLYQPHISAGRIPTEKGFRFYVDSILNVHELSDQEQHELRSCYSIHEMEGADLFRETSRILSSSSHYLGIVWAPRLSSAVLQHTEFVKFRKHLILAILVSTTGLVYHRIIEMEEVFIEGKTNILHEPEFRTLPKMVDLFKAFEEKATMVGLLDKFMDPKGVQIAIGSESQVQEMETCSLGTSTYGCGGRVWGALGVIGPRRMNYSKIIPLVDYSAKVLTEILERQYRLQ